MPTHADAHDTLTLLPPVGVGGVSGTPQGEGTEAWSGEYENGLLPSVEVWSMRWRDGGVVRTRARTAR